MDLKIEEREQYANKYYLTENIKWCWSQWRILWLVCVQALKVERGSVQVPVENEVFIIFK